MQTKPGGRGDFIVAVDGRVLWDKRKTHEDKFPEPQAILKQLGAA